MSRYTIAAATISMLIVLPSCSLLLDMSPDGVIDDSGVAGTSGKGSGHGIAGSNGGTLVENPDSTGNAAATGAVAGEEPLSVGGTTASLGGTLAAGAAAAAGGLAGIAGGTAGESGRAGGTLGK